MQIARPILISQLAILATPSIVLAQTSTPSATTTATTPTKGGLPEAGNITPTVLIVTLGVILVVVGFVRLFKSFR